MTPQDTTTTATKNTTFTCCSELHTSTQSAYKGHSTIIVIPVYNESRNIIPVIEKCKQAGYASIIIINDGSTDHTKELAEKCNVHVISHLINRGQGAAIQTGIQAALSLGADYIVTMDGDQQFDPQDISKILAPLIAGEAEVIIGSRFKQKNSIPFIRRFFNLIANCLTFSLSGIYVSDSQSGFKGFNKKAAAQIEIHTSGYEFCTEIIREISYLGLTYKEVPVNVYYSQESMQKGQNLANGFKTAAKLLVRSLMN